jgi:primosomal protein N' (replication factor Y)
MPVVRIVDMRIETQREGRMHVLSRDLMKAIEDRLARAEQTILFLNRRGYATSLVCPKCGHTESHGRGDPCFQKTCPKCGAKMTRS